MPVVYYKGRNMILSVWWFPSDALCGPFTCKTRLVSMAQNIPRGAAGQMENKPLCLHGMLHEPSPSTRLRLCPTKQLVNELLWSRASERADTHLIWYWKRCVEDARCQRCAGGGGGRKWLFSFMEEGEIWVLEDGAQFIKKQMPWQMYVNTTDLFLSSSIVIYDIMCCSLWM